MPLVRALLVRPVDRDDEEQTAEQAEAELARMVGGPKIDVVM